MSSLKDRMYNYEVTPPPDVWEKISNDISEAELGNKYPVTLYNIETAPPPAVWDKIETILNPVHQPAATSIFRRMFPVARYAAAAILIGIIAFVIIKFAAGGNNDNNSSVQAKNGNSDTSQPSGQNSPAVNSTANNTETDDDKALEQSKLLVAKLDAPLKKGTRRTSSYARNVQYNYADFTDRELSQSIYAYEDHVPAIAERYVMLMTPDGNIIRMSKKWGELLCCVSGEEQDADCKDQLKKWQEKIATSSLAPSPGNFMDILGLINSLDENVEL